MKSKRLFIILFFLAALVIMKLLDLTYELGYSEAKKKFEEEKNIQERKSLLVINKLNNLNSKYKEDMLIMQAKISSDYQNKLKESSNEYEKTIADLNNGNIRLRGSISCTVDHIRRMSKAADASNRSISVKKRLCGLSKEDAEFLIEFSRRTEDMKHQLNSLIDIIIEYQNKTQEFNKNID